MRQHRWKLMWAVAPLIGLAWHYGPGQQQLARDRAGAFAQEGRAAAENEDWPRALAAFQRALDCLSEHAAAGATLRDAPSGSEGVSTEQTPDVAADSARIRLEIARAKMRSGEILAAGEELEKLLSDVNQAPKKNQALIDETRHELATTDYYTAWLMRLDGATPEEWRPEAEKARQHFRLLAEEAGATATPELAESAIRNLEAVIRLEQMSEEQLLARPPPKKCNGDCKGLCQRKRKRSLARCQGGNPNQGQKQQGPQDARKQIQESRGAGLNQRGGDGS